MRRFFEKVYKGDTVSLYGMLESALLNEEKRFIVTANSEILVRGEKDENIARLLTNDETTVVADGISVVRGLEILNMPACERIPGIEIAQKLLEMCNTYKKSLYLFGAREEILTSLKEVLAEIYPNINLVGSCNGYIADKDKVFEEIKTLSPDAVFVALGVPMQEELIFKHLKDFKKGVFVGLGGSFDVLSGNKKRAPEFFIKYNLEWLYRIIKEPSRIKRFVNNNVRFIFILKRKYR